MAAPVGRWQALAQAAARNPNLWTQIARNPYGGHPPNQPTYGPGAPPRAPGAPPAGGPAAPAAAAGQPPSSPYDSTYYSNVAANQFKTNNQINALNLQGSQNDTALQTALAQLAYQQPRDSLKLEQGFNQRGGLYSSVEGQGLGDLTHSYATRQTAAQTQHDNRASSLAAQISALRQGIPIYDAEQGAAAAGRASAAALKDPTLGQPTGGLDTSGAQPPAPGAAGSGPGGRRTVAQVIANPLPPSQGRRTGSVPGTIMGRGTATWGALSQPGVAQGYANALLNTARRRRP